MMTTLIYNGKIYLEKGRFAQALLVEGGIIKAPAAMRACKVMRVCPKCNKPTRLGHKILDDGSKVSVCKKCGETFND